MNFIWNSKIDRISDWLSNNYIKIIIAISLVFAALLLPVAFDLFVLVKKTLNELNTQRGDPEKIKDYAYAIGVGLTALVALIGAPLVLVRTWINERQARTAEARHITDRMLKAIDQLGAVREVDGKTIPALEIRVGAIYVLERIAQESELDHITVMEALCAYIRQNAPANEAEDHDLGVRPKSENGGKYADPQVEAWCKQLESWVQRQKSPRIDIQTALEVIARRSENRIEYERDPRKTEGDKFGRYSYKLNLSHTNLRKAALTNARLQYAFLHGSKLEGANLAGANLDMTHFRATKLDGACLMRASLKGASFYESSMEDWQKPFTTLRRKEYCGENNLKHEAISEVFLDESTALPAHMDMVERNWIARSDANENGHFDACYEHWLRERYPELWKADYERL